MTDPLVWPPGTGEMAGRIRGHDWMATPLGPRTAWSPRLRLLVEMMLASPLPTTLHCGRDARILLYNDAAARVLGSEHPLAFGGPAGDGRSAGTAVPAPLLDRAFDGETVGPGAASPVPDGQPVSLITPVREEGGDVAYVYAAWVGGFLRPAAPAVDERASRETQMRQAFLLRLSDALQPVVDPAAIRERAARILGEQLGAERAVFLVLAGRAEAPPEPAGLRIFAACPVVLAALRAGEPVVVSDAEASPPLSPDAAAALRALSLRSAVSLPVVKQGRLLACMCVFRARPHAWTEPELALVRHAAERTWAALDRARAEDRITRRNAVLTGINRIFREALAARTEEELGRFCLAVAEEVTGSAFSFLGEVNAGTNRLNEISVSDRGWDAFAMDDPAFPKGRPPTGLRIHGIYGRALLDGKGHIANEPAAHPDRVGVPQGHPPLKAFLGVPLIEAGRTIGLIGLANRPGGYRQEDLRTAETLAPAILQALRSKRTSDALRESEARFAQFAACSSDALWIREAAGLTLEFASPSVATVYGIAPADLLGDVRLWAALIVPEDRAAALEALERARHGEAVAHEFRIQRPSDGAFRWIHTTTFPLFDARGGVQRIGGIAEDVTDARLSSEHQAVLVAELQHRVRNIMAMIRSISLHTAERAGSVSDYAALLAGRLLTLARVQTLLTRGGNAGVGIRTLVADELAAQAAHEEQYALTGPDLVLAPKSAEVLTLAVHELTTNALKYGALATRTGRVAVQWWLTRDHGQPWLCFHWIEHGAPGRPEPEQQRRRGFGSELIEARLPYELGGRGELRIGPCGAHCVLEFPLRDGASILATDAPEAASMKGGTLDMAGMVDLSGECILVVEDDFYLATDTARVVRRAGGTVLGPCPSEAAARAVLAAGAPTGAVLDINLGAGPSFALARELRGRGIPLLFITGYDEAVIPAEFAGVARLQKPVELAEIVGTLGRIARGGSA
ncbi:MAG: GAF domain-containing protein [Methylobacterium frigidaeris]